jgi:hypothetical protein
MQPFTASGSPLSKDLLQKGDRTVNVFRSLLLSCLLTGSLAAQVMQPYLSNLRATKDSPLFTTYAAAMERSEFTLDEGYHLVFYDSSRGIDLVTDNAGIWSVGFRKGSRFVYALRDMSKPPVVTVSYPDMVRYEYAPFDSIRVNITFVVHSSRMAVQEVAITNELHERTTIDVIPFLQNPDRAFNDVSLLVPQKTIAFTHEEFPDSWVRDHGVPFVERVRDLFVFSHQPDRLSSFRSYRWGGVEIPQTIEMNKKPVYTVWGRMTDRSGERCLHRTPPPRMLVLLNGDRKRILIENAPRWGNTESNINAYALYGVELGNFGVIRSGDTSTVMLSCGATGDGATVRAAVGDTAKARDRRIDVRFGSVAGPRAPENVRRDIWGSGTELRLYWKPAEPGVLYDVYRRDYGAGGVYERVAAGMEQTFFTDKNVPDDKIYGYVVTAVDGHGLMSMHSNEVNNIEGSDFLTDVKFPGQVKGDARELSRVVSAWKTLVIAPGTTERLRAVRAMYRPDEDQAQILAAAERLMSEDLDRYLRANELLFSRVPPPRFADPDKTMLYWSAYSLMRQVMLPPEGKCGFNYYVFSREPQWGWGHGGQVFHESLTMLAYALMDPMSAMNSQRVYRERQHEGGYINYRTGPYLDETIPTGGQLTSSAPWYAWQNWEVYRLTKDRTFLDQMYQSSAAFYRYFVKSRDTDGDGLCEWGGEAVLESVRDARVAVWDEVGGPSEFEAVDANSMLVMEAKALSAMAAELGRSAEAGDWRKDAEKRSARINETFWDEKTGFYYQVDKKDHGFTFKKADDLKREEIIGFLPLWAGIPDSARAHRLVEKLTDPRKFWRPFGVPTLAADDPYYNPKGYWNGPVWVQWDYLIERGLLEYGYKKEARELVDRIAAGMVAQLKKDHNLWEFYSPDEPWAGYHKTYIWAGIITRMMHDVLE